MQIIMEVIIQGLSSYTYIAMLIALFLYIYTLLGMQMYGGQWNFKDGTPRMIYDSFFMAFICVFDLLTMENWNSQLFWALHSKVTPALSILFLISSLFILNYVLLNLFMAIMLDGFDQDTFKADVQDSFEDMAPDLNLQDSYFASTVAASQSAMIKQSQMLPGNNNPNNNFSQSFFQFNPHGNPNPNSNNPKVAQSITMGPHNANNVPNINVTNASQPTLVTPKAVSQVSGVQLQSNNLMMTMQMPVNGEPL